jgi:hypothetical protein
VAPQLIWKGNIQELRHFTLDVLKLTGKWKSPGGDVKMFTASDERFVFKWQGSKKKKIEIVKDHDDDLLSRLKNNAHEENKANVTRENDDPIEHQSRSQSMPVRGLGCGMTLGKSNFFYPK